MCISYLYKMKMLSVAVLIGLLAGVPAKAQIVFSKIDTTVKIGKVGYRVECKNKRVDENQVDIRPIGFDNSARELPFMLRGRVAKAEIDDLNGDGFPDLVIYIYTDSAAIFGTVDAFISKANKSIVGCPLPDAMMDGKINQGYKGHDQFSLMEGYLMDKFPIYKAGDEKDKPSGGMRVVLYQLVPDGERYKFQKVRNYDTP
jgi:hypothetical protein